MSLERVSARHIYWGLGAGGVLASAVGAGLYWQASHSDIVLSFSQEQLQQQLATNFPSKSELSNVVTMNYSTPVIKLTEGSDRMGIGLDVDTEIGMSLTFHGHVAGDWKMRYDPSQTALYFDDLRLSELTVKDVPPKTMATVKMLAEPLIRNYLLHTPVYKLKAGDFRQELARRTLKSVTVKNGKLVVVLGVG